MTHHSYPGWRERYRARRKHCAACLCVESDEPGDAHVVIEAHHIVWRSRGGGDEASNLMELCHDCHVVVHQEAEEDPEDVELVKLVIPAGEGPWEYRPPTEFLDPSFLMIPDWRLG